MSGSVAGKRLGPEYSESAPCLLICWEKKNSAPTNLKMEPTQECWMTSEPLDHAMPGGIPHIHYMSRYTPPHAFLLTYLSRVVYYLKIKILMNT